MKKSIVLFGFKDLLLVHALARCTELTLDPEVSVYPIQKLSPEVLDVIIRKNSRTHTTEW